MSAKRRSMSKPPRGKGRYGVPAISRMKESASIAVIRGATFGASLRISPIVSSVSTWV
jgi:hypothetical protein